YKSFISTKSNIFKFNFEKLQDSLIFDISNFPKELVEEIIRQQFVVEIYEINLDQELIDRILEIGSADLGFCNQFSHALSYFYTMKLKLPEYYKLQRTEEILDEFFQYLELVIQEIIKKNNFEIGNVDISFYHLDFENFVPEFKKEDNSRGAITLSGGVITDSDLTYCLNFAKLLLQFWKRKYIRKELNDRDYCWHKDQQPYKDLSKREVLNNPDIYFPRLEEKAREHLDLFKRKVKLKEKAFNESLVKKLVEFVSLPYWRHRWYIYELWTLINVSMTIAQLGDFKLNTLHRKGHIEIKIPKANAKEPVGEIKIGKKVLEIWYQRKTYNPITGEGLEPDIRVSLKPERYSFIPEDILIIENKDRKKASGSHIDKIANKYAKGTTSECLFILNYESYSRKDLQDYINYKTVDEKEIFILSYFKPTNFYIMDFFKKKILQVVDYYLKAKKDTSGEIHILLDISYSMLGDKINTCKELILVLYNIFRKLGYDFKVFIFNTHLIKEINFSELNKIKAYGATDLKTTFEQYSKIYSKNKKKDTTIIIIFTDSDSHSECKKLDLIENVVCIEIDKL
ncbi:hypothetical protein DRO97_08825, partial [Archaeoglobales archaeon]